MSDRYLTSVSFVKTMGGCDAGLSKPCTSNCTYSLLVYTDDGSCLVGSNGPNMTKWNRDGFELYSLVKSLFSRSAANLAIGRIPRKREPVSRYENRY